MFIDSLPSDRNKFLDATLEEYEGTLLMYQDYYKGAGNQWKSFEETAQGRVLVQRGFETRSGKRLYDILPQDLLRSAGFFGDNESEEALLANQGSNIIKRIYEWAEANIIDHAVDEKARSVRGVGEMSFAFENVNEIGTEMFNKWWKQTRGSHKTTQLNKDASINSFSAAWIVNNVLVQIPSENVFVDKDGSVLVFYHITVAQAKAFFLNITGRELETRKADTDSVWFTKRCTNLMVEYFIDGELVLEEVHGFTVNPVVIFQNDDIGSDVAEDIPVQDNINAILTRSQEAFKQHLSPAVSINSNKLLENFKASKIKGKAPFIKRGPGVLTVLESDGKMQYHQWNGIPNGVQEQLETIERMWSAKRGVFFSERFGSIPESGEAKKESRRVLFSRAQDSREVMEVGLDHVAQLWFETRGFTEDVITDVEWGEMIDISESERRERAIQDWSVHRSTRQYLKDIGKTDEEIDDILSEVSDTLETVMFT